MLIHSETILKLKCVQINKFFYKHTIYLNQTNTHFITPAKLCVQDTTFILISLKSVILYIWIIFSIFLFSFFFVIFQCIFVYSFSYTVYFYFVSFIQICCTFTKDYFFKYRSRPKILITLKSMILCILMNIFSIRNTGPAHLKTI